MGCRQKREVDTSFYYWKTVYKQHKTENSYLKQLGSKRLYVRIMDVDLNDEYKPIPIAPISFADKLPAHLESVPVVYIMNDVLKTENKPDPKVLAAKITKFVQAKMLQGGKKQFKELQIDCDWTESTRDTYFTLLETIKKLNQDKIISVTLRLHQLKNQAKNGIPPVDQALLMCYNMGNLRKYGAQNSVLDVKELKKYAQDNLAAYPMKLDMALPIFSWAVVFRYQDYNGISKRLKYSDLQDRKMFQKQPNGLYKAEKDLPQFGLWKSDEVRWEESKLDDVKETAKHLAKYLPRKPFNLVFYHLDEDLLKNFKVYELKEIAALLH
ncbi:MAG: hypothetical protein REI93_13450 [Pedobacter sp.]|nr:hypothetical protein [Pedobacter sp.]